MPGGFMQHIWKAWLSSDVTGTIINSRNVTSCTLTGGAGAGTFDIVLDEALDANEMLPIVCVHTTAANAIVRVTSTSDTVKRITMIDDAGAAIDAAFYAAFLQVAWGGH
jgi:hypothetical protein